MKISESIIKLLIEENEVSINGFGIFRTEMTNATIHPITKEVTPPQKKVVFERYKQTNSLRFEHVVASDNNVDIDEARKQINEVFGKYNSDLQIYRKIIVEGFASLKLNTDDTIDVIVEENIIFDKEFFAFPSFQINTPKVETMEDNTKNPDSVEEQKPILTTEPIIQPPVDDGVISEQKEAQAPKKKKSWIWLILLLIILGGIGTAGFLFKDKIIEVFNGGSSKIEVKVEEKELVVKEEQKVIEEIIDTVPQVVEEVAIVEEVKPEVVKTKKSNSGGANNYVKPVDISKLSYAPVGGGKYYVIAGSFKLIENAATLVAQLIKQGYNPVVIEKNEQGLIRVAYKPGFDTERLARDFADDLYENKNLLPWIVKF